MTRKLTSLVAAAAAASGLLSVGIAQADTEDAVQPGVTTPAEVMPLQPKRTPHNLAPKAVTLPMLVMLSLVPRPLQLQWITAGKHQLSPAPRLRR